MPVELVMPAEPVQTGNMSDLIITACGHNGLTGEPASSVLIGPKASNVFLNNLLNTMSIGTCLILE